MTPQSGWVLELCISEIICRTMTFWVSLVLVYVYVYPCVWGEMYMHPPLCIATVDADYNYIV